MQQMFSVVFLAFVLAMSGCASTREADEDGQNAVEQRNHLNADEVVDVGTIRFISRDGGYYVIQTDEGEQYNPINLRRGFWEDGLRVRFYGKIRQMLGYHTWGTAIEIEEIWRL